MTVTLRFPQAGHMRRDSGRDSRKFGSRVATSVSRSSCFAVDALPHRSRFQTVAAIAAHMHLPPKAARYAQCLDFQRTKVEQSTGAVKRDGRRAPNGTDVSWGAVYIAMELARVCPGWMWRVSAGAQWATLLDHNEPSDVRGNANDH